MRASLDTGLPAVLRLAWPTVISLVLNNGFRINDQYWVQGLGGAAHAAIGSSTILLILNFAVIFLAVGGSVPLVARATGANDISERDSVIRHTLLLGLAVAVVLGVGGWWLTPAMTGAFGVGEDVAPLMIAYMRTIYLCILPLVLAPILDNLFLAMGNTRIPLGLQVVAVSFNLVLNPLLIYGVGDFEGFGIAGAALATGLSRVAACVIGLVLLMRLYRVSLWRGVQIRVSRCVDVIRLGIPVALSIGVYAGVYAFLFALVISDLGSDVGAGFGIGFNAFESVSYPFFLGVAMAGASLVGRNLGARRVDQAWVAIRHVRWVGRTVGILFGAVFVFGGPLIAPWFTSESGALAETLSYVGILGWSQVLVAEEVVNEKVLFGAGHPRPIFLISTLGNVARIPIGWWLAVHLGYGAVGLWWTINLTSLVKAGLFHIEVQRGRWVRSLDLRIAATN